MTALPGRAWPARSAASRAPAVPRGTIFSGRGTHLLTRRTPRDALEGDLARPVGPVRAATRLGCPAWELELAAGRGEEHPLYVVVDAATGLVLEERVDAVGAVDAWTDLTVGDALDDALFTWTGSTGGHDPLAALMERHGAEREAERAAESRWWSQHVTQLRRSASVEVDLDLSLEGIHHREPDGSFQASLGRGFGAPLAASLARRPRSDTTWNLRWYGEPPAHRWSTERWDRAFRLYETTLAEEGCAAVERCFGDGGPGER